MKPLSLLFLNPLAEEDWGGVETWMLAVARGLARRDFAVTACARPGSRFLDRFGSEGFSGVTLAFRRDFGPFDVLKLRRSLRKLDVDCVITKLDRGIRAAGLARALGGGAAVVMRQGLFEVKEGFRHRFAYRWVDRIVTPAACLKTEIAETGVLPEGRIDHVPNGVDTERFRPDPERGRAFREARGLGGGPLLVNTSRLHDQKGHAELLRAFQGLPGTPRLALAGAGKREERIRTLAAELGVADRVSFLGHVDDVPGLLAAADLFVLSSRFEGMPNNVLEAMATALPVVATNVGDVARMIDDGVSGRIVEAEDPSALGGAISEVLAAPDTAAAMAEAARARVTERYTIAAMVDGTEACVRKAAAR